MIQLVSKKKNLADELLVIYLIQLLKNPTNARINAIELMVNDKGASLSFDEFKAELPYLSDEEYKLAEERLQPSVYLVEEKAAPVSAPALSRAA